MAGHRLTQRIDALEHEAGGNAVLLVVEQGRIEWFQAAFDAY